MPQDSPINFPSLTAKVADWVLRLRHSPRSFNPWFALDSLTQWRKGDFDQIAKVQTYSSCREGGNFLEQRTFRVLNGVVSFQEKIKESLQKVKRIASKSEINTLRSGSKTRTFSHFEAVEAFFPINLFHFLKSILDIGIQGGAFARPSLFEKRIKRGYLVREPQLGVSNGD